MSAPPATLPAPAPKPGPDVGATVRVVPVAPGERPAPAEEGYEALREAQHAAHVPPPVMRTARAPRSEAVFYALGMTPERYLATVFLPMWAAAVLSGFLLPLLLAPLMGSLVAGLLGVFTAVLATGYGLYYPYQSYAQRGQRIDQMMHLFITHLGVLATTPMPRVEIFASLAAKEGYGPLAEDCGKIHSLVRHWNLSLPEACRFVAARTPSTALNDFLDRLAHALEGEDPVDEFLYNEQAVVLSDWGSDYRRRLADLAGFRELFGSIVMGASFMAVFVLMMPLLADVPIGSILPLVLITMATLLFSLVVVAWLKSPRDPLWMPGADRHPGHRRARLAMLPCAALGLAAGAAAFALQLPLAMAVAAGATPLALGARLMAREEARVRRAEENYSAFIRSLGSGAAARGGMALAAVERMQRHNFGPLTPPLRSLHRRLALQLDAASSWTAFAQENGSALIHDFTAMFLEGARQGGHLPRIGALLGRNAAHVVALRKDRAQVSRGVRGLLYGMGGAVSFTLYLNLAILGMLMGLFSPDALAVGALPGLADFGESRGQAELFVLGVNVLYALAAGCIIRMVDGGRLQGGFADVVGMLWVGTILSVGVGDILAAMT